ncbi:DsbC family protein [Nitrosomonas eutropha]|uniref:Thiol:disulfide interchange protein n=2 Tax=Nitrosomonas eutropha TaxID=916 RepID=A0ABX5MCU0_9PROT|nr:DsbC family protein [Nitrosomonas eutropha]ABI59929.1 putative thiol:disulfide interchange protein [Nitrosomonas eutropha C91]PXV81616.1 thiol:disulfide interchange protein DsbC [Nitrosomonas eutropha]SCX22652.1 thiol:disulfide interchange protein DsbC [Nitrosomonas eutropha]SEJ09505.1 thiol:disulfide interchange protein DsbC [Nitrosomonas eutropha]
MRLFLYSFGLLGLLFTGIAQANEADLKEAIQAHFPGSKIESLTQTPYLGLYEAVIDGEIFYTDEKAEYFFMGHIVDAKKRASLTSERMQQIRDSRRIAIDTLPLEHALKMVKGNGKRTLIVYSDPNCPYCKRLEKELVNVTDITIYTLLYPVLNGSMTTAEAIWCSEDRVKAWDDFMLKSVVPTGKNCDAPLQILLESGRQNRVTGTPTLIFADGSVVPGFIPQSEIEKRLDQATSK